jgi:hypothetical protein
MSSFTKRNLSWTQRSVIGLHLRLIRRQVRRLAQMAYYRRLSIKDVPVFFANSFPKSGTHLLIQVIQGFTRIGPAIDSGLPAIVTFEGDTGRQRKETEILRDFHRLLPGDIGYGHVHALPGVVEYMCRGGVAAYFILRDPRDVAISHVYYLTEMEPRHIHHRYFQEVLKTFDERLMATIEGVGGDEIEFRSDILGTGKGEWKRINLPSIRERFEPFMGWLEHPEVLTMRYEDLNDQREAALEQILDHAILRGFQPNINRQAAIRMLDASIRPQRSPTFRSGKSGGWRSAFSEEHKGLFKEITGDLLIRLGYEKNDHW